jgi:hypothetical protein
MQFDGNEPTTKWIWGMVIWLVLFSFFLIYCLVSFWPTVPPLTVSFVEPSAGLAGETVKISGSGFSNSMTVSFEDEDALGSPIAGSSVVGTIDKTESNALTVKLPKHGAGVMRLVVRDSTGQAVAIPHGFTFNKPPTESPATTPPPTQTTPSSPGSKAPAAGKNPGGQGKPPLPPAASANTTKTPSTASENPPANPATPAAGASSAAAGNSEAKAAVPQTEHRNIEVSDESEVDFFWFHFWFRYPVRILIIVMIVGTLGSLMHVVRSFFWYVGNRELKNSWLMMYLLMPFNGAGLAALFYLIIRGGISPQAPTSPSSLDGYAAIAALVGLFSQQAMEKLKQIADAFFSSVSPGRNSIPAPAATTPIPIDPPDGPATGGTSVKITGSGFAQGDTVRFDNLDATNVVVGSPTQLTATTPVHAAGVVDVEVSNAAGNKVVTLPKSFTYK